MCTYSIFNPDNAPPGGGGGGGVIGCKDDGKMRRISFCGVPVNLVPRRDTAGARKFRGDVVETKCECFP